MPVLQSPASIENVNRLAANNSIKRDTFFSRAATSDEFQVHSFKIDNHIVKISKVITKPVLEGEPGFQRVVHKNEVVYENISLKYYKTNVNYTEDGTTYKVREINIIHEDSEGDLKRACNIIATNAKKTKDREVRNGYWAELRDLNAHFANVAYNYAITVHKAQGGTYTKCFIMEADVMKNSRIRERNRIFYTGLTRPTDHLLVIYTASENNEGRTFLNPSYALGVTKRSEL